MAVNRRSWTRRRLLTASGSGLLRFALSAPAYLMSVPLLLLWLGREQYGLWVLITTLTGWLFLSDFGLRTMIVRESGRAAVSGEFDGIDTLVGQAGTVYLLVNVLIGVAALLGIPWLVHTVFALEGEIAGQAVRVLLLGTAAFMIDLVGLGLFRGVSDGFGHIAQNNMVALTYTWVRAGALLYCGWATRNVVLMAWVAIAVSVVGLLAWRMAAAKAAPGLSYRLRALSRADIRRMAGFAGVVQLNDAIAAAVPQLIEVIVLRRFGLAALGLFDVGVQLFIHLRSASFVAWFPVMPWLSGRQVESSTVWKAPLERRLMTTAVSVAAGGAGVVAMVGPWLVDTWLPETTVAEVAAVCVMLIAGLVMGATAPVIYVINAEGKPVKATLLLSTYGLVWVLGTLSVAPSSATILVAFWGVVAATAALGVAMVIKRSSFADARGWLLMLCVLASASCACALLLSTGSNFGFLAGLSTVVLAAAVLGVALGVGGTRGGAQRA